MSPFLARAAENEYVEAPISEAHKFYSLVMSGLLRRCDNNHDRCRYQITRRGLQQVAASTRRRTE